MSAAMKRIWIQLTADRKRFGVLCATVGVGLLLWARLIIVSGVSRTAMAEDGKKPMAEAQAGAESAADRPGKSAGGSEADKRGEKPGAAARETVEVRLWSRSERDPFVISPEHFPRTKSDKEVKGDAGKLPTEPAEDAGQKEARLVARLREVLGTLRLEAAMGNTMAIIDGKRYVVGESLPLMGKERVEFKLQEVRQRSVVLEAEGRRFEVEMSVPGAASPAPRSGN